MGLVDKKINGIWGELEKIVGTFNLLSETVHKLLHYCTLHNHLQIQDEIDKQGMVKKKINILAQNIIGEGGKKISSSSLKLHKKIFMYFFRHCSDSKINKQTDRSKWETATTQKLARPPDKQPEDRAPQ